MDEKLHNGELHDRNSLPKERARLENLSVGGRLITKWFRRNGRGSMDSLLQTRWRPSGLIKF